MYCFECRKSIASTAAEAVCRKCGAGLCMEHARIEEHELHHEAGLGMRTHDFPARRIVCPVCAMAEHSP
jgi:hypothetical protein